MICPRSHLQGGITRDRPGTLLTAPTGLTQIREGQGSTQSNTRLYTDLGKSKEVCSHSYTNQGGYSLLSTAPPGPTQNRALYQPWTGLRCCSQLLPALHHPGTCLGQYPHLLLALCQSGTSPGPRSQVPGPTGPELTEGEARVQLLTGLTPNSAEPRTLLTLSLAL